MQDVHAEIIINENLCGDYWRIGLRTGWKEYCPGQFVMLKVPCIDTLLRRPFSICRMKDGILEVCYKVRGKGTFALSTAKVGEKLWVMGPLGNGFKISGQILLIAGGYGIAPLLGLAEKLAVSRRPSVVSLFYGASSKEHLLYLDEFKKLEVELHITTEDGSMGQKGMVTDILNEHLRRTKDEERRTILACGPHGMLAEVAKIAKKRKIDCEVSLEASMACGIGVCMGCAVKAKDDGYLMACKDGPVFNLGADFSLPHICQTKVWLPKL